MKKIIIITMALLIILMATACDIGGKVQMVQGQKSEVQSNTEETQVVTPESKIIKLENGFSVVSYNEDYGFDKFLSEKGASSDGEVIGFLTQNLLSGVDLSFLGEMFGCSTISVNNSNNEALFGRNFDWENCEAMVVLSAPKSDYASISTVNMDFIKQGASGIAGVALQVDKISTIAALYAPLDGLNEAGLAVAVNMIQDSATIEQNTDKPDITTTTAIRLLLNKAADVTEAIALLESYDMHASMGMMVHFAMADTKGNSVVVEYINNEMVVTNTPVVTNFYLAEGEKNGVGSAQSHERFEILTTALEEKNVMNTQDVKSAIDSVSKDGFNEFESTEWSVIFNQTTLEAKYYHRENFKKSYVFNLK